MPLKVCGIDPAGSRGSTGIAVAVGECRGLWRIIYADAGRGWYSIMSKLLGCLVVGVDAPPRLPYRGFRRVERAAMRVIGARLLPGGSRGMSLLSVRGYSIRQLLEEAGVAYIETHPGTIAMLSGIRDRGDVVDAVLAALAAAGHYCGSARYVIDEDGVLAFVRVAFREWVRLALVYGV